MSYDLHVYATGLTPSLASTWAARLTSYGPLSYEIDPRVKLEVGHIGFCPIKVTEPPSLDLSSSKHYMSGFELYIVEFEAEEFFDLQSGNIAEKRANLEEEGIDFELWESFSVRFLISFKPDNRFEAELSFMSAAIFTDELNGFCVDPQTGHKAAKAEVLPWANTQVKVYHRRTKSDELVAHPFEGWVGL